MSERRVRLTSTAEKTMPECIENLHGDLYLYEMGELGPRRLIRSLAEELPKIEAAYRKVRSELQDCRTQLKRLRRGATK